MVLARSLAASGAATGVSFNDTLQTLGIADAMKPKIKIAQGGRGAMELLANVATPHRDDGGRQQYMAFLPMRR